MPLLSPAERENALGRLQAGQSATDVAHALNVSPGTICRLWSRFQRTGSSAEAMRSGRPRITTPAQDRLIGPSNLSVSFCVQCVGPLLRLFLVYLSNALSLQLSTGMIFNNAEAILDHWGIL